MSDIGKITTALDDIGVEYVVREVTIGDTVYQYLFIGEYRNIFAPEMTFENGDLDTLLATSKFFEFENSSLAGYSNS